MRATTTPRRRGWLMATAVLAVSALALAGCSSSTDDSGSGDDSAKDTIRYALPQGTGPNWIFPMSAPDKMATHNQALRATMWAPLFEYNGTSGTMEWDKKASSAKEYEFNEDNTAVTITLNDLEWSDGTPLTSRDVEFWFNLAKANTEKFGGYSAGNIPDNITTFETVDDKKFTLTFDKAYNQDFMLANQLTLVSPMPHHAWAKDSADGEVGDGDRDADGAVKIFDFLFEQAEDMKTYATSDLWKVVNGPYTVSKWTDSGEVTLTANEKYTGDDKAATKNVVFMPFTSADAEMNAVRAKEVDYGYITSSQLETEQQFVDLGYEVKPWKGWSITYMPYNFANPEMGPVFKQLYVRQALQSAIDQETISDKIWQGAATPDYGPIPQANDTDYLSDEQKDNPYPYDLTAAEKYLTDNGWAKGSDGIMECTAAGTEAGQCGEGIAAGTKLEIVVMTQNGSQETDNMMAELKSSFEKIGVGMTIDSAPLDNVLTEAQKCKTGNDCTWQLVFFGTAGSWYFPAYPTGERVFAKETKWNAGQYDNPEAEAIISQMTTSSDTTIAKQYSKMLAEDLPVMWMPNPVYQISVVSTDLNLNSEQDPGGNFYPQRWSWK